MGHDEMNPCMLSKQTDVIVRLLLTIFEKLRQLGEVPADW